MLELRTQLERKISQLALPHQRGESRGPPSSKLADIETVVRPSAEEVRTRYLLPLLQHTHTGSLEPKHEDAIIDLCLEELHAALLARAPELCTLARAVRVAVGSTFGRRTATVADMPSARRGDAGGGDAGGAATRSDLQPHPPPMPKPASSRGATGAVAPSVAGGDDAAPAPARPAADCGEGGESGESAAPGGVPPRGDGGDGGDGAAAHGAGHHVRDVRTRPVTGEESELAEAEAATRLQAE